MMGGQAAKKEKRRRRAKDDEHGASTPTSSALLASRPPAPTRPCGGNQIGICIASRGSIDMSSAGVVSKQASLETTACAGCAASYSAGRWPVTGSTRSGDAPEIPENEPQNGTPQGQKNGQGAGGSQGPNH